MLAALELARVLGRRRGGEQGKASRPHLLGGGPRQWRRPRLDWSAQIKKTKLVNTHLMANENKFPLKKKGGKTFTSNALKLNES